VTAWPYPRIIVVVNARSVVRGVALVGASLAVGALTAAGRGRELDEEAFRAANRERGPVADRAFSGVTELGSIWASVGAAAAMAAAGRRRAAARGLAAASLTWIAGQGLKRVVERPRPADADPDGTHLRIRRPNGSSWPSSHPAVLVAFTTVAADDLGADVPARLGLDVLAVAVGVSRAYLGVHYPADVVGGLLLGRAVASVFDGRR
jgi:membrane-associated phospholipid phosphatase